MTGPSYAPGVWALACLLLTCVMAGCRADSPPEPPTSSAGAALRQVSLPDITALDAGLQERLRREHVATIADVEDPARTAEARADSYGRFGKLLLAAELPDVAEACFLNARALAPRDMRWPYYLGHVYLLTHRPAMAAAMFEAGLALEPDHLPSMVWLAEAQLSLGDAARAESYAARAVTLEPRSAAAWSRRGRAAIASGDYSRAVQDLEEALTLQPDADAIHYQFGLALRGAGEATRAQAHLRRQGDASAIAPADPLMDELPGLLQDGSAYMARGLEALERRDWAAATTALRKASELSPTDGGVQLNLGTALFLSGDRRGARTAYEAAIRLSPRMPNAHYTLGLLAEAEGRDAEAIERFSAAVRLDPAYVDAQFSLADAFRRSGQVEQSLIHYQNVLSINPAASQARFGHAMGLVRLRRYREARDGLRRARELHPDQPGLTHALARLLAAAPEDGVRSGAMALSLLEELLKTHRSVALSETMAMAMAELGRFDEAVDWQTSALRDAGDAAHPGTRTRLDEGLRRYLRREPCRVPWSDDDPIHAPRPQSDGER